ncbi:MAG: HAMP domain-containing histidine kinase [Sandaracinus sp.]|nr:HAMP domain-containing histidine kinase [Sandaracinus sp.]MCB9623465.1 HAMP domain-containing histidine kinase [Sandaracinus sp.]
MRLERRLLLFGVALPVALMVAAGIGVDVVLGREMVEGLDRSLRAQAAAESVSLFDGPDGRVHFHAIQSPLRAVLGNPDAAIAAYGPDGALLSKSASARAAPATLRLEGDEPRLSDREGARVLEIAVPSPDGERYALWLSAPRDELDATVRAFRRAGGLAAVFVTLLLVLVQRRHARWVAGRAERLAAHMHRLERGVFDEDPPLDPVPDVLGELRDSVADATSRLREAKRAQEQLVAGAAHELRTPLAAMRATVDVTLRRPRTEEELRGALDEVREEVDKLERRATDLLDLAAASSRTALGLERRVLRELAEETARRFAADAAERDVTIDVGGEEVEVAVAPDLVRRALDNLVSNALRYAPSGSTVRLEARVEGDECGVLVSDEGPGVPEAERDTLFVPFHKADRRSPGAGLGLALVAEIARAHGGRVELRPSERGASFWWALPR